MPDARARRIAENESRFRAINERLQRDLRALPPEAEPIPFICECGRAECAEPVRMLVDEYESVRADPNQFAVVPGHEILSVEDVIGTFDRFLVVRKHAETRSIVEGNDPRRGAGDGAS